jgi:hypothetical protein
LPWTISSATAKKNNVRDLFYSLARGRGNVDHYWFVRPQKMQNKNKNDNFYHNNQMSIAIEDILAILTRENITLSSALRGTAVA